MNPDRWQRIKDLHQQALDRPADEREAFVREACGDDAELLAEVLELLAIDNSSLGEFMVPPPSVDSTCELAGKMLGEFKLIGELGRGGMGVVYLAEQPSLGRHVAVKVLPSLLPDRDRHVERFRREAAAIARLSHANIVPIHAFDEHDGTLFYAMALVDGRTLADVIADETEPFSVEEVVRLVVTVLRALDYAHERGVVHRDVKPRNVLIQPDGEPMIVDFGLAKVSELESISAADEVVGTPHYMSPEQAADRTRVGVDHRTDVYSAAAVLYEMLTKTRPFDGRTSAEIFECIVYQDPKPVRALNPNVRPALARICMQGLRKDPDQRYQSCAEFADDLERFLRGEPINARPERASSRIRRFVRKHRFAVTIPILLVAGLGVGALFGNESRAATKAGAHVDSSRDIVHITARRLGNAPESWGPAIELSDGERLEPGAYRIRTETVKGEYAEHFRVIHHPGDDAHVVSHPTAAPSPADPNYARVAPGTYTVWIWRKNEADLVPVQVRSEGFLIQKATVTNREYLEYATAIGGGSEAWASQRAMAPDADAFLDLPCTNVTWFEARDYAEWRGMRLPTSAERQIAIGGTLSEWESMLATDPGEWNLDRTTSVTTSDDYFAFVEPSHAPQRKFGMHGIMHPIGNVFEWLESPMHWQGEDGAWLADHAHRMKGGLAWCVSSERTRQNNIAHVIHGEPHTHSADSGFRCAKSLPDID